MRLTAYVLAADPTWVEESVGSYYDLVDRIVVAYDENDRGWSGRPIDASGTVRRLQAIDRDHKLDLLPGDFYVPGAYPLDSDTRQRQAALDAASDGADWVLQLDTDEILPDPDALMGALRATDAGGHAGLHFPARRVVQHLGGSWYLENARRAWRVRAGYPGPVAIRPGSTLTHCRQGPDDLYRVDLRPTNTDPYHPHDAPVHAVVGRDQAILHLSWVRSDDDLTRKLGTFGHAHDRDWAGHVDRWQRLRRQPWRALLNPLTRDTDRMLRPAYLPHGPDLAARRRNGLPS